MGRFETAILATEESLAAMTDLPGAWSDKVHDRRLPKIIALDMESYANPMILIAESDEACIKPLGRRGNAG